MDLKNKIIEELNKDNTNWDLVLELTKISQSMEIDINSFGFKKGVINFIKTTRQYDGFSMTPFIKIFGDDLVYHVDHKKYKFVEGKINVVSSYSNTPMIHFMRENIAFNKVKVATHDNYFNISLGEERKVLRKVLDKDLDSCKGEYLAEKRDNKLKSILK